MEEYICPICNLKQYSASTKEAICYKCGRKLTAVEENRSNILQGLSAIYQEFGEQFRKEAKEAWESLNYETRLRVTGYIFEKLKEHYREGGTYRYLIYDRLGFGLDAYVPLYLCGGLEISNAFYEAKLITNKEDKKDNGK